ncbi:MAG: peptidase S10 [Rhizobiales bacterium]|nr:peptidase S10 [Hyphomicrobiales bacterium]
MRFVRGLGPGLALVVGLAMAALAQAPADHPPAARGQGRERPVAEKSVGARLPEDRETRHELALPGRSLAFAAVAGSIALTNPQGAPQLEIAYTYYRREPSQPNRPLVFAFNGGPGSASAWLHLGALGPWRLDMTGAALGPSAPPLLVPNAETWLDFADLVFIDPPGTGFSRFVAEGDDLRRTAFSVDGDIELLGAFVRRFLDRTDRRAAPKFIVGESYGGFRGPLLARRLQSHEGIGVDGLVLVSPALDFRRAPAMATPVADAARLPSFAAVALEARGAFGPEAMAAAEAYAGGEYLTDLMRGPRDAQAVARVAERVAALTGLDRETVRRLAGRVDVGTFRREFGRADGRVASAYDGAVSGADPFPSSAHGNFEDPFSDAVAAPLTSAVVTLTRATLGWKPDGAYRLSNPEVNQAWNWARGRDRSEALSALAQALALDPRLRVLIAHGYTDLVTPYFATALALRQMPGAGAERIRLGLFSGGHMFYARAASRVDFRAQARALVAGE